MKPAGAMGDQRGFALLAVMLVLALLSVAITEFAFSMRLEAAMVRSYKDATLARHLAEAGIQQGIREVLSDATVHGLDDDGQVVFYRSGGGVVATNRLPELPRSHTALGAGEFSYRITDEEARLSLNSGNPSQLITLLTDLGVEKEQRDIIIDSLQDWRDSNDTRRLNGAESDDYIQSPVPYRARNGNLQEVAELLQIKGVTPELYYGQGDRPGLVDLVTVRSRGTINLNTAPKLVLKAAGLSEAEVDDVVQSRGAQAYGSVPARYTSRGSTRFTVGSATFRIEATGLIGGEPRARMLAIVQRSVGAQTGAAPTLTVYAWRPLPPRPPAADEGAKEGAPSR
jgi:type II secretory pathway component PulK